MYFAIHLTILEFVLLQKQRHDPYCNLTILQFVLLQNIVLILIVT